MRYSLFWSVESNLVGFVVLVPGPMVLASELERGGRGEVNDRPQAPWCVRGSIMMVTGVYTKSLCGTGYGRPGIC